MTKKEKKVFDEWANDIKVLEDIKKRSLQELKDIFENYIGIHKPISDHETLACIFKSDIDLDVKMRAIIRINTCNQMDTMVNERETLALKMYGTTTA